MLKSKVIDILKTFSKDEFKKFEDFVSSPYFNRNKTIIKLTAVLKKFYPDFKSPSMTEENIYKLIYGKDKSSNSLIRNLMSGMIPICENFLVHNKLSLKVEKGITISLLEEYRERHLDNLFNLRCEIFEKELKKSDIPKNEYYPQAYEAEILKYQYHLEKHSHSKLIWKGFLKKAALELCSVFQTLYLTGDTLIQSQELLKGNADDSIFVKFLKRVDLENFVNDFDPGEDEENFFIHFFSKLILMSTHYRNDVSEKYYSDVKTSFLKNQRLFSNHDLYDVLKSMRSYCIERMRMGKPVFIDELYETDKLLLNKIKYDQMRIKWFIAEIYFEIITLSVYKKDYKYAENFILKYSEYLDDDSKGFEIGRAKAFLSLHYGKVEDALKHLSPIKPMNNVRKIQIKNLYLRVYYELGFYEEAFSILDAYKHFVNKEEKFSDFQKDYFNRTHGIYSRLYRYKTKPGSYSEFDLLKLSDDLNEFYFLSDMEWFIQKIAELSAVNIKKYKNNKNLNA